MKWIKRGWLVPSLESADGQWKIYYDEFGQVACKKVGTRNGWYLGCQEVDNTAISIAESKIAQYGSSKYDHIT